MIVIPGPSSLGLGWRIAERLGVEPTPVEHRVFPDGESYIKLTKQVAGENVVIVQTTAPNPDTRLMQLLLMARTAKDFGAEKVVAVVPYLAYARQDKRFTDLESLSLDVIFGMLECAGVTDLVTVNIHNEASTRGVEERHKVRFHNVSAVPLLAEYLKKEGFGGAYSLSPDKGAIYIAEAASKVLGGGYNYFEKTRDRKTGEITMAVKDLNIGGRKAVVFDDMISSGGHDGEGSRGPHGPGRGEGRSRLHTRPLHARSRGEDQEGGRRPDNRDEHHRDPLQQGQRSRHHRRQAQGNSLS